MLLAALVAAMAAPSMIDVLLTLSPSNDSKQNPVTLCVDRVDLTADPWNFLIEKAKPHLESEPEYSAKANIYIYWKERNYIFGEHSFAKRVPSIPAIDSPEDLLYDGMVPLSVWFTPTKAAKKRASSEHFRAQEELSNYNRRQEQRREQRVCTF